MLLRSIFASLTLTPREIKTTNGRTGLAGSRARSWKGGAVRSGTSARPSLRKSGTTNSGGPAYDFDASETTTQWLAMRIHDTNSYNVLITLFLTMFLILLRLFGVKSLSPTVCVFRVPVTQIRIDLR